MLEAFRLGGWGMFPTLFFGLVLIATAVFYAGRSDRRLVPLLASLSALTLLSGALGFVTGVMKSFFAIADVTADQRYIAVLGVGESLSNIALALVLVIIAALAVALRELRWMRGNPERALAPQP